MNQRSPLRLRPATMMTVVVVLLAALLYLWWIDGSAPPTKVDAGGPSTESPAAATAPVGREETVRVAASEASVSDVTAVRVLDAETGDPVPSATGAEAPRGTRLCLVTGAEGRADAAGLIVLAEPAPESLLVGAPGYASCHVTVTRGRTVEARLLRLQWATIRCLDEAGGPIEGVFVAASPEPIVGRPFATAAGAWLSGEAGPRSISCARSGADGTAHVAIAEAGEYWLRPWSEHMACTDASLFERPKVLRPGEPVTLTFREFEAVAIYSDEAPIRSHEVSFLASARGRVDRDARHMLFEREFVVQAAERELRGRWPSVVVHAFVARARDSGLPVEVSGLLEDGRTFAATVISMPVRRLVPTAVRGDAAGAVARVIVRSDVVAPDGFDLVRKGDRPRLRAPAAEAVLVPEGDYVVSFAGEWVGGRPVGEAIRVLGSSTSEVMLSAEQHRPVLLSIRTADVPAVGRVQLHWRLQEGGEKRSFNWNPRTDRLAWLPIGRHRLEVFCPGYANADVAFELVDRVEPVEVVVELTAR